MRNAIGIIIYSALVYAILDAFAQQMYERGYQSGCKQSGIKPKIVIQKDIVLKYPFNPSKQMEFFDETNTDSPTSAA